MSRLREDLSLFTIAIYVVILLAWALPLAYSAACLHAFWPWVDFVTKDHGAWSVDNNRVMLAFLTIVVAAALMCVPLALQAFTKKSRNLAPAAMASGTSWSAVLLSLIWWLLCHGAAIA